MTMHLVGPYLSLNGKKKGRVKFRNADEARKARDLDASWKELQKKWDVDLEEKRRKRALKAEPLIYKLNTPAERSTAHIPSVSTPGHSTATVHKVYTGTKVKGIATMHKSNAVPVFSNEEAVEISRMRRG
jgi:hypothetical protein